MIRNIVVGRVKDGTDPAEVENGLQELRALQVPGIEFTLIAELDLGLRPGNADFVVVVDLADEHAYRTYDADPEHGRIRRETLGPLCSAIERIQFRVADGPWSRSPPAHSRRLDT